MKFQPVKCEAVVYRQLVMKGTKLLRVEGDIPNNPHCRMFHCVGEFQNGVLTSVRPHDVVLTKQETVSEIHPF